jgi:hypothetical protein
MTLKKSQKRMKEIGREESNNARDRLGSNPFLAVGRGRFPTCPARTAGVAP